MVYVYSKYKYCYKNRVPILLRVPTYEYERVYHWSSSNKYFKQRKNKTRFRYLYNDGPSKQIRLRGYVQNTPDAYHPSSAYLTYFYKALWEVNRTIKNMRKSFKRLERFDSNFPYSFFYNSLPLQCIEICINANILEFLLHAIFWHIPELVGVKQV